MTIDKIKFVVILLLGFSIMAKSQDIQFTEMESLPEARSSLTSANNGDAIFIVNGFGENEQYTDEIYQYDIAMNSWSILTSSTIPKRYASAAVIGDYLYVFNGVTENSGLNSAVERIDLVNGSVENLSNNPQPCRAAGVTKWEGKIYSFGGTLEPNEYSNKLYEFDPESNIWTELAEIPFAGETKGEIVDGKLYIIGGYNGVVSNRIDVYNLSTNEWEDNFEMPVGISAHATAIIDKKIYLVGDFSNLTSVAYFDTSDSDFQMLTNNLNERRHCAAEGVKGSLFAIGGNTASNIESSITSVQKADIITSINEIAEIGLIEVSPNPTNRHLYLNKTYEKIVIYDIQGKEIGVYNNIANINVSNLKKGMYFFKGKIGKQFYQGKFNRM